MKTLSAVITILCLAMVAPAADLVKNGSFELPVCSTMPANCFVETGAVGLFWTVEWAEAAGSTAAGSRGILEIWRGAVAGVSQKDGWQNIELDTHNRPGTSNNNVQIYQSIATCPGANYSLAYSWMKRPDWPINSGTPPTTTTRRRRQMGRIHPGNPHDAQHF
jgi:hypothetical protein